MILSWRGCQQVKTNFPYSPPVQCMMSQPWTTWSVRNKIICKQRPTQIHQMNPGFQVVAILLQSSHWMTAHAVTWAWTEPILATSPSSPLAPAPLKLGMGCLSSSWSFTDEIHPSPPTSQLNTNTLPGVGNNLKRFWKLRVGEHFRGLRAFFLLFHCFQNVMFWYTLIQSLLNGIVTALHRAP